MEATSSASSSSGAIESLLQVLTSRGWCFKDVDRVKDLISDHLSSRGIPCTVDSIQLELVNMDLRSIGGKSLPDHSRLRQASYLQGPNVLQISSVRDISRSGMEESLGNSSKRRLLRLKLTDGHSEIVAIEYSQIPSISDNVVPGTKVCLLNKVVVHNGIVCLSAKTTTVLGGHVQSLYEEWQMNQKYSGFSRSSARTSHESTASGPPPFEKFQVGASLQQQSRALQYSRSSSKSSGPSSAEISESSPSSQINKLQSHDVTVDGKKVDVQHPARVEHAGERTNNSEKRQKEVVETAPVQNQAAAQKLLQRMSQPNRDHQSFRGRKHRGKEREEGPAVLTLDEWERRKAGISTSSTQNITDVSQDEDLARQLQEQFDLEDIHVQKDSHAMDAENIRMSMFNFERNDAGGNGGMGSRGRGRGRGRGRRGGRGRGGFGLS